jgi:hypothetical protein
MGLVIHPPPEPCVSMEDVVIIHSLTGTKAGPDRALWGTEVTGTCPIPGDPDPTTGHFNAL